MTAIRPNPPGWGLIPVPARVAERAATKYTVDPESGCHLSTYSLYPSGYAQVGWNEAGRRCHTTAHRAAWVHHTGTQIPQGKTVDHRIAEGCTSRRCVKFEHLRELDNYENARRTDGRDWPLGTCAHGHGPEHHRLIGTRWKCGICDDASKTKSAQRPEAKAIKADWQRRRRAAVRAARS